MRVAYNSWLDAVRRRLVHPDAINCTVLGADETVFKAWHQAGFTPARVAGRLNERWRIKRAKAADEVTP